MTTLKLSQPKNTTGRATSSAAVSPAKTCPTPVQVRDSMAAGQIYGLKCCGSFAWFDRNMSQWKTYQRCLDGEWEPWSAVWPKSGTSSNGIAFRHLPSAHRIDEIEFGLSRTQTNQIVATPALWPTPTIAGNYNQKGAGKKSGNGLATEVAKRIWPTPRASEWKGTGPLGSKSHRYRLDRKYLDATVQDAEKATGALNPVWVEWLMGFPPNWTDIGKPNQQTRRESQPA